MIQMNRRKLIGGIGLLIAAPAIVKVSNIMRVKAQEPWPAPNTIIYTNGRAYSFILPKHGGFVEGDRITLYQGSDKVHGSIISVDASVIDIVAKPFTAVKGPGNTGWKPYA
jgi:hypothetical protein